MHKDVVAFLDQKAPELFRIADEVWSYAELGFKEYKSAELQASFLEQNGFSVKRQAGGIPTAFVAEWGEGKPIIGFLGEYDALAGVSQEVSPERKPVVPGAPGHGCGHNLLGTGALGAALAVKNALEKSGKKATVRYYGCPAEEMLAGKVYMAREGLFSDLDVAITWHPGSINTVQVSSYTSMNSARFAFHGKTAHAAGDPHNGRSALDAVELMNVGANYLREHIIKDATIHYVITNGGGQPNVVPAEAEVWYFVRAPKRRQTEEIYERLVDVAKGAALMTGTTFDIKFLTGCYECLINKTLVDVMWDVMQEIGAPSYDEADLEFARKLSTTFDKGSLDSFKQSPIFQENPELKNQIINNTLVKPTSQPKTGGGSTDVGDVSWIVPTVQVSTATNPLGCPGHSWQYCASAGSMIGKKGMLAASKYMAACALKLVEKPEIIGKAWEEFRELTKEEPYKCPFPAGVPFPLDEFWNEKK